ncbi:hypothetical protein DFH07DRAFT_775955 [Mycena maculata]|uniref:KOW domain-containing protein n=1 Tax=Mycena maculata TaxID=230809 RepID=A0AAD7N6D7_9AGAR|nr:hypothetical protein DFH07DRAFT_775955 [Mycena maculata]
MKYIDEYASEDDCERSESEDNDDNSLEAQIRAADQRDFTDAQWAQIRTENDGLFIACQLAAAKALQQTPEECDQIVCNSVLCMRLFYSGGSGEEDDEQEDTELWGAPDDEEDLVPQGKGKAKATENLPTPFPEEWSDRTPLFAPNSQGPTPYEGPGRFPTLLVGPAPTPFPEERRDHTPLFVPSSRGPALYTGPQRSRTPLLEPQRLLPPVLLSLQEPRPLVPSRRTFSEVQHSQDSPAPVPSSSAKVTPPPRVSPPPTSSSSSARPVTRPSKRRRVQRNSVAQFFDTEEEHDEDGEDEDEDKELEPGPSFADREVNPHKVGNMYVQRARQQRYSKHYDDALAATKDMLAHDPLPGLLRYLAEKHEAMARNARYPTPADPWFYRVKLDGLYPDANIFLVYLVPRSSHQPGLTEMERKLFDPKEFPTSEPLVGGGVRWRERDFRYGLLVEDIRQSQVGFYDQKDVHPSHYELELWIASECPDLNTPRRQTPMTMAIMEGDHIVWCVPRREKATDIPSAADIFLLKGRLPQEQYQAMVQKRQEYRAFQKTRNPAEVEAERKAENERDEADRDGWVVQTTTTVTALGRTQWAIVKHRTGPASHQTKPSVVWISDLGHHLLAPVRSVLRNDQVVVVNGEDALGKIGQVIEVKEAMGTIIICSSLPNHNDVDEVNEVRINNVHLQFFVSDVVEVIGGRHRGRIGFVIHVSPGLVDVFDPVPPPPVTVDPNYQQQIAIIPVWLKFLDTEDARDKDGVTYDRVQRERIFCDLVRVGDPLIHKEVCIVGGPLAHNTHTANEFKGQFGMVTSWDPRPSRLPGLQDAATLKQLAVRLGGTRAMFEGARIAVRVEHHGGQLVHLPIERLRLCSSSTEAPVMLIDSLNARHWQPKYSAKNPPSAALSNLLPTPPGLLVLPGEDSRGWLCLPALVGKHVDVMIRGVSALVGVKGLMLGVRVVALEGKRGYLLMQASMQHNLQVAAKCLNLNKQKVTVHGFTSLHNVPLVAVKPCRVFHDGRSLEELTERVVIIGPDCQNEKGDQGCYAQVQREEQDPPGTVMVCVSRPGSFALNGFPLLHLCLAKNIPGQLENMSFPATTF